MNVVSRAITLTFSGEGYESCLRQWNKGTVWELGNCCMLEKRASQWLSSGKSQPRKQSASEDFNTENCCWYRFLTSDIGKSTLPETGFSAWFAAKGQQWAGWSWIWKLTESRSKSRCAGHTSASIANCCNWRATDVKIYRDTLVVYDRIENRWFMGETMGVHCAAASLMRRLL